MREAVIFEDDYPTGYLAISDEGIAGGPDKPTRGNEETDVVSQVSSRQGGMKLISGHPPRKCDHEPVFRLWVHFEPSHGCVDLAAISRVYASEVGDVVASFGTARQVEHARGVPLLSCGVSDKGGLGHRIVKISANEADGYSGSHILVILPDERQADLGSYHITCGVNFDTVKDSEHPVGRQGLYKRCGYG